MSKKSAIIGFTSDTNNFSFINEKEGKPFTNSFFKKPDICKKDEPCICLCTDKLNFIGWDNSVTCLGEMICSPRIQDEWKLPELADRINIDDGQFKGYWQGGFIIHRSDFKPEVYGVLSGGQKQTLFLERYKDVVAACKKSPCLTIEQKKEIDKGYELRNKEDQKKQAIEKFDEFKKEYTECQKKQGNCAIYKADIPADYLIVYNHDSSTGKFGFYLINSPFNANFEKNAIIKDNNLDLFYGGLIYKPDNTELENGDIFASSNSFNLKNQNGYIIVEAVK